MILKTMSKTNHVLLPKTDEKKEEFDYFKPREHFRCSYCSEIYFKNSELRKHIRKVHPGQEQPAIKRRKLHEAKCCRDISGFVSTIGDGTNAKKKEEFDWFKLVEKCFCSYCPESYFRNSDLRKHVRRVHPGQEQPHDLRKKRFQQTTEINGTEGPHGNLQATSASAKSGNTIIRQKMAKIKGINLITKTFNSYQEFESWRDDEEDSTRSRFVKAQGDKKMSHYTLRRYKCHRSGRYHEMKNRKRRLRCRGSAKIGTICPAVMVLKIFPDGHCILSYCKDHKGHDFELKHLTLRKSQRSQLASKIALGTNFNKILREFHSTAEPHTRYKLLVSRKNLMNISKEFRIGRNVPHSVKVNQDELIGNLATERTEHEQTNIEDGRLNTEGVESILHNNSQTVEEEMEEVNSSFRILSQFNRKENPLAVRTLNNGLLHLIRVMSQGVPLQPEVPPTEHVNKVHSIVSFRIN